MTDQRIMRSIVEQCDFFYDDALLSKEKIIEKYLIFFARQFDPTERSVSFAFHTGSLCFDVVSVAALMIGCLAYEFSSNDEILAELKPGDMVLYKDERYHWVGVNRIEEKDYIILTQDAKGKKGSLTLSVPYERNKHLIKRYFGDSSITDGRGIKKEKANRDDFISYILEIHPADVPTAIDLSIVVVANLNEFIEICNHLKIRYNGNKTVELTDVMPVSYYTENSEKQIGKNVSKAEAVIKVTSKMSIARDLVLDRQGNKVIGLMVTNTESLTFNSAELKDLIRRNSLKFVCIVMPYDSDSCEFIMNQYESAHVFACTKELLSGSCHEIKSANKLTEELNRQISNILSHKITIVKADSVWSWEQYRNIMQKLYVLKQSNWNEEDKNNFIRSAMALIRLFKTAFFNMKQMEKAISSGSINLSVVSPELRIDRLTDIASKTLSMREQCNEIVLTLLDMYSSLYNSSPKETALRRFLKTYHDKKIAIVVPKAYYVELFTLAFQSEFGNAVCVTANRFDPHAQYDMVIAPGDIIGKRFDALQCFVAPEIVLFLYDFEEKTFSFRKRKSAKSERRLNARIKGLKGDNSSKAVEDDDTNDPEITERIMSEFSDLDNFIDSVGTFDIHRLAVTNNGGEYSNVTEVEYVGVFTTGEKILFSRYYSAVVFNQDNGTVEEKSPKKLLPGDILVFTKRNDYTSNIVDQIFGQLMMTKKLPPEALDAAEKVSYWKAALREYKDVNELTFKVIAKELNRHEVTTRQWLIENSRIIGPRDVKTMRMIAKVTNDPYLLNNSDGYFEACRIIRGYRRKILNLIAKAINDKLGNKQPLRGSVLEVVHENVEKLSETMELEKVIALDDIAMINNGMVNRPISESEVLL